MKPLLCILGCSGSGKSTLVEELEQKYLLKQIPSYTTRLPRYPNERGHTFISQEEFDKIRNDLVAYATTTGSEYGVTTQQIDNKIHVLYVVDLTGLKSLKENYKGNRQIVSVFINCGIKDRYERLHKRYERQYKDYNKATTETLNRIKHDESEFLHAKEYCDYTIENHNGNYANAMMNLISICNENNLFN